ncbi:hypothetical protein GPK74_04340 [Coprococcus catus]|uniref:hypothetical protein n=1 Tax=Coprococcus catus TaxID=116085 RepID=UPI001C00DECD|nr:hypothetical protein [Coprococcus catus]MBT9769203.1 hypothetical protein [Coprococcus catus]
MNYLEHKTLVKYGDGLLAHSQEWQWLIDEIEARFEIKEIGSWQQYLSGYGPIRDVFEYFVKVLKVCDKSWIYSRKEFEEIWEIAKFYIGIIDVRECMEKISHNQCKVFLFCIWLTKLENGDNECEYLLDMRLLNQRNYFELIKCDSLLEHEQELLDYAHTIAVAGLDIPLKYLCDNLNQIEYPCNTEFLLNYKKEILNYNAFSFQNIAREACQTWQEVYLLDMLNVSLNKRNIQPMYTDTNVSFPDISGWSKDVLNAVKRYFNHSITNFAVESVAYVKFNIEPSKEVKLLHCKLLMEAIESGVESYKILSSSSYHILSYLFCDKLMGDCNKEEACINLIKRIQKWENPAWIINLKKDGYPISKEQRNLLSEFLANKYKQIDNVLSLYDLKNYLEDKTTANAITTEYLRKVSKKFESYTEEEAGILVAAVYYEYMLYLIEVNQSNTNIDKRYVQKEMIHIQKIWQEKIYKKQCGNLHEFSHEQKIGTKELEKFSDVALLNPVIFAKNCTPSSEDEILNIMMSISENPLLHLFKGMTLTPVFPMERDKIVYERHDIDKILQQYVNDLKNRKGYKLLNQLDSKIFVAGIHARYKFNTQCSMTFFIKEEKLYNEVKKECSIELLPYTNIESLALLTQLFPVLEMKIRELATLFGIFPFKKKSNEFMQYNDPSSLLRELIEMLFEEQHSFESVPDLIYVYNIMYNSNSYNVRNECIHGRDYLSGGSFRFAFRATLFAVHMIDFRIKTIRNNVSDIIELEE